MKPLTRKILAAKLAAILAAASITGAVAPAYAGIPVIDGSNLSQNIITAVENVAHTLKQIQQYQTQLQQYQNMLQNTTAPARQIWDMATATMNQLRAAIDTLSYYKNSLGSIDAYLAKFNDTTGYRASPCYSVNGCSAAQWAAMTDSARLGSESQKKANDALFKGLSAADQYASRCSTTATPAISSARLKWAIRSNWLCQSAREPPIEPASANKSSAHRSTECYSDPQSGTR